MAIDLSMSCSPKGVSRYHLISLTDGLLASLPGTGMCTFINVCRNMTTFLFLYSLPRNKEYMGTRWPSDPCSHWSMPMRYVACLSIFLCIELFCASSLCYCLGRCLFVQCPGDTEYCASHDFPRFPCVWRCHCHHTMVSNREISHVYQLIHCVVQVRCQPPLTITAFTFNPCRLTSRVGLCIWCSHKCLLSFLPHSVPSTAILAAYHPQGLLGMSLDRKYPLSCSVSVFNSISVTWWH